jgi:peptidoglycan/xylan/chitin deacetylase (PgdA/CDA1 family)
VRAILTWHSIDDSGSPISVTPAAFRRQVEWLASGRVRVLPLEAIASGSGEDDAVALTFDDGFWNFATEAAPALLARGLPVTLFVVTDHVGRTNAWGGRTDPAVPELPLLDWDQLGRLAEHGVAIESHTRRHPWLPSLGDVALADELGASAERIEGELGRRPRWLAYPFGAENEAVRAAAERHYAGAVTTEYRPLGPGADRYAAPRLDAWYFQAPGALDRWNRPGFRQALWVRRQARSARALWRRAMGGRGR